MTIFDRSLPATMGGGTSVRQRELSDDVRMRRRLQRRHALLAQFGSYTSMTIVMATYAYAEAISATVPIFYLLAGGAVTSAFWLSSQSGFNDRFNDHYLTIWQMVANIALQLGFLLVTPQIGCVYLCMIILIFAFANLRMTVRDAAIGWTLMTFSIAPLFLMTDLQFSLPNTTFLERFASLLLYVSTIAQCAVIGLFGSGLRNQLYHRKAALKAAYDRIEELAEIDELTGAHNRRSIMRRLSDDIARGARLKRSCSVALIDLDWFKRINDTYGHPAGDEVLRTFAITAFANIREFDSFGRYGGEEFMLILPETSQSEAVRILDRLRLIFSEIDWSGLSPDLTISLSAGIATGLPNETGEEMLARADAALYAAKRNGRNRVASAA